MKYMSKEGKKVIKREDIMEEPEKRESASTILDENENGIVETKNNKNKWLSKHKNEVK